MNDVPRRLYYFDRRPSDAITAESVRKYARIEIPDGCRCVMCQAKIDRFTLIGLLDHSGVSSSARAVIETAIAGAR